MQTANLTELAISLLLEIWLIVLLVRRQAHSRFRLFFLFTILETLAVAGRLATVSRYGTYFYVYWCSEAVVLAFSLAALHEVFHWIFEGFFRFRWFRLSYYGTIVVVLASAIWNAFVSPPVQAHPIISIILDAGVAVNIIRMGIIGLFAALDKILEMGYERHAHGIVIGFGISSIGALVGFLTFSGFGPKVISFARNAPAVAYILALAVWVAVFMRPEPEDDEWTPPMSPEQMLEEVQSYLRALDILKRLLRRGR